MIRLFANANYDFIKWRRWAYGLTAAIIIPGFALFLVRGLNYSIEFTGGTLIQVQTAEPVGPDRIRSALDAAGIRAVLATFHDILTTIAFIRYLDLEVSLVVVGAVLTMGGYSLNDTIIIFDRVRENLRKFRRHNLYEILNLSINETLPRSVLTHGTTMATTLAIVFLAGEVLRPFALVMTFAIFTGTFSSVYIAAPILMYIEKRWPGEDARGARQFRPGAAPASPASPAPGAPPRAPQPPQPQTMR